MTRVANSNKSDPNTYMRFEKVTVDGEDIPAIVLHTPGFILLQSPSVCIPTPINIKWNPDNDSYIKTIIFDGKTIEQEFKLVVNNKDTDNEEVVALILPNGDTINFEGWTT